MLSAASSVSIAKCSANAFAAFSRFNGIDTTGRGLTNPASMAAARIEPNSPRPDPFQEVEPLPGKLVELALGSDGNSRNTPTLRLRTRQIA